MSCSDQVDLDQLFNFLSCEVPDSVQSGSIRSSSVTGSSETPEKSSILDEIDRQMSDLQNEIDRYSLKSPPPPPPAVEGREPSPPPLPPPMDCHNTPAATLQMAKPSLPEPEGPPPPPPVQNGYAFNTPHLSQEVRNPLQMNNKPKEPIYESIKPRPEPLGGPGDESDQEYGFTMPIIPPTEFKTSKVTQPMIPNVQTNGIYGPVQQPLQQQHLPPPPVDTEREARRAMRVRRELERIQEVEEDKENDEHFNMIDFAENYFNDHEKSPQGTLVGTLKRSKTLELLPKSGMISYYKGNSIPNSHIHMFDPENVNIACNIFKDLTKYAKGENKDEAEVSIIQTIIRYGLDREELRDEIYVQCARQINKNPNQEHVDRIWLLLCLVVVAFPPGKSFFKYFVSFLRDQQDTPEPTKQYVEWCLENCNHVQAAIRRNPPSTVEITAMKRLGTIVCRFFFLDTRTKALDVHPCDTAQDVLQKLADKIGLQSLEGWALYQSLGDDEDHISQHSYLYDIISDWEISSHQTKSSQNNKSSPNKKSNLKKRPVSGGDNRFIMKKRLFWNSHEIPSDPIEVSLLYAQAVHSVVKCDELPVSEKVALQLAGLQAQVALGEPQLGRPELYQDIDTFLPQRIKQARFLADREWIPILNEAHKHYGSGKAEVVAKVWYLSCVMQYPLYGCTMFPATYRGYWSYGNNIIINVNAEGVILVKSDDKFILFEFPYSEIESLLLDPSDNFITLNLVKTAVERQRVYVFETPQKVAIGALVAAYRPTLANWIREADAPKRRAKQITNEDRMRLHQNLVNCRRALIEQNLVKKPLDGGGDGSNFFKNTLRRLSVKKMEKFRAEALANEQGEVYKGFTHIYWAFSKATMSQTLSSMTEGDEQQALEVFHLILTYAGLMQNTNNGKTPAEINGGDSPGATNKEEEDHVFLIQTVLDKAMKKDCLVNELFLQLIKQTVDHPEPNSRVNLRHWSLLALACSVILPVDKLVRKYLLAHLKKCSADFVTEEGKYARFAEKVNTLI